MSNEYAGLVSELNYEKLQAENKALESRLLIKELRWKEVLAENKTLKASRDELLETLKLAKTIYERDGLPGQSFMRTTIQKAEALKAKEK